MKQRRDRQRKCTLQAARIPGCRGSSGHLTLRNIRRSDRRPLQDKLVVLLWPLGSVLVLLPRIQRVNISQKLTEKGRQSSVLNHREDPGVVDTGIGGSKVSQENTRFLRSTRDMGQSSGNLKDVVRRLP